VAAVADIKAAVVVMPVVVAVDIKVAAATSNL
jgi:hypothetical protein